MNIKDIRREFPIYDNIPNLVYLDSGATALKPKCVLDKMNEYYSQYGVNIHRGVYALSYQATDEYDKAREIVSKFINSDFKEVVFTKNVSEALNKICLILVIFYFTYVIILTKGKCFHNLYFTRG